MLGVLVIVGLIVLRHLNTVPYRLNFCGKRPIT